MCESKNSEEIKEQVEEEMIIKPVECEEGRERINPIYPMQRVAKFEKVSFETFLKEYTPMWVEMQRLILGIEKGESFGYDKNELEEDAKTIYDEIKLPTRSTQYSAGYDFYFPYGDTVLPAGANIRIPSGIKVMMEPGWVLIEAPRSGMGMTYRIQFDNTIDIIDGDYYNNDKNEGHIIIKLTNDSREGLSCTFEKGCRYCQGMFLPYGITYDDNVTAVREGGLGSTGA